MAGQAVSEVLGHVEQRAAADHAEPGHVVACVEQVGAVRRRMHQAVLRLGDAAGECHVFSFLIELGLRVGREAVSEARFSGKLMRKFSLRRHGSTMLSRGSDESVVQLQGREAGFGPFAVRHIQEPAFRLGVIVRGGLRI